jgi:hypothetical protein
MRPSSPLIHNHGDTLHRHNTTPLAGAAALKTNYPSNWAFPDDALDLFLKIGGAAITAATAVAAGTVAVKRVRQSQADEQN